MNIGLKENWYKKIPDDVNVDEEIKSYLDAIGVAGKMIHDKFFFNYVHFDVDPKTIIPPNVTSIKAKLRIGLEGKTLYFKVPSIVICISGSNMDSGSFYMLPINKDKSISYPIEHTSLTPSSMGGYHEYHHHITKKESFIKSLEHLLHKI